MAERCDKLAGVDIPAYLTAPEDARWSTMRAHVAKCRDCSAELEAWRSLRASLAVGGDGHPAEELLLVYADERSSLTTTVSGQIQDHLAECTSCRDEVGVLRAVTIRPTEAKATPADSKTAKSSVWQRCLASISGPVWRPALALAVLIVLMVPALRWIDHESALMQIDTTRDDEAMVVSSESDAVQASREGVSPITAPERVRRKESSNLDAMDAPTSRIAAPQAEPPTAKQAPPAPVLAQRKVRQREQEADLRVHPGQLNAERSASWLHRDDASALAMRKGPALDATAMPPTLEFVPGGSVSLPPGDYDRVVLRLTFVRAADAATGWRADEQGAGGTSSHEPASPVAVPSTVSELEVRVTTAAGRQRIWRVNVAPAKPGETSSTLELSIAADSLASGANAFEIAEPGGRTIAAAPFVVDRGK